MSYGTGDDVNCGTGVGVVAGAAVRTRGPWLLALTGDLLIAGPLGCTDIGRVATYRGEQVEERAYVDFAPGVRLGIRAGRALRGRGVMFEPGLAGGVLNGKVDAGSRTAERAWKPWAAGLLAIQPEGWRVRLRAEYGAYAVPVSYVRGVRTVVHEFNRWKPLLLLTVGI